ncbi:hypothetical protein HanRHA438_Chr17g0841391 [Helianthus annuus]|nr:hypothetical protein HanRHA438_Chr17g0841391 [Helianthus annuus]
MAEPRRLVAGRPRQKWAPSFLWRPPNTTPTNSVISGPRRFSGRSAPLVSPVTPTRSRS